MASDADWVEDVKRWYFAGRRQDEVAVAGAAPEDADALGYEAAHPSLQAAGWPDAPVTGAPSATG